MRGARMEDLRVDALPGLHRYTRPMGTRGWSPPPAGAGTSRRTDPRLGRRHRGLSAAAGLLALDDEV